MQAQQVVTSLQRIAAEAVQIETAAAGDENALPLRTAVIDALHIVAPLTVLVDLVEHPKRRSGQLAFQNPLTVVCDVIVQVAALCVGNALRERGLADPAWTGDEHHLASQVAADLRIEVAESVWHE